MGGFRSRAASNRDNSSGSQPARSGMSKGYQQRRSADKKMKAKSHGSGDRVRDVAFTALQAVTVEEAFGNIVLPQLLKEHKLSGRDSAFATELTYGTLRAAGLLDAVIEKASGRPVGKIDSIVLDILRLGTYQILRTRVDDHAAVHTSVELAKAHGAAPAKGFVNGVLRTITRSTPEQWLDRVAGGEGLADLALRHAHPEWIAEVFNDALSGAGETGVASQLEEALRADDERPRVHLAARPGQMSAEELALVTGGDEGRYSPYAVYVDHGAPGDLEPVRDGLATVQDEGSQLIALAVTRAPLEREDQGRWLDLCAGPGGKTGFMAAWAMGEQARVDAVELAPHRAELVRKSVRDLPVDVHVGDGRYPASIDTLDIPSGGFDRVLVDAPCTGLGALRRRPEARWRKSPEDVAPLVTLQKELLRAALAATAEGGVTVYSTCSPHPQETSAVVRAIAAETGAEILDTASLVPEVDGLEPGPFVQLWPHKHGTDAMFFAALRPARKDSAGRRADAETEVE